MLAATQIIAGLVMLGLGGDALVRGAVGIAERLRISPLVTGLVLVGFGTSVPELVTSLSAVLKGSPDIAVGNVVGSNIANVLLILGITAAIAPIATDPKAFRRDAPTLAVATLACVVFAFSGSFERSTGLLFVLALIGYVVFTYRKERKSFDEQAQLHAREAELVTPVGHALSISLGIAIVGIALVVWGANLMVTGSIFIAREWGVPETVIGLTIVAVGTSLPELATSVVAAFRRQTDIAFGNIVGSNIFNIFGIIGLTAIVMPIPIAPKILVYDFWILIGVTALLLWAAYTDKKVSRSEGVLFMALYGLYLAFLGLRAMALI